MENVVSKMINTFGGLRVEIDKDKPNLICEVNTKGVIEMNQYTWNLIKNDINKMELGRNSCRK
jgi:hypothetical protein